MDFISAFYRGFYRVSKRHAIAKSFGNSVDANSEFIGPINGTHSPALVFMKNVSSLVSGLNESRRPATITGLVVSIYIYSIKGVILGWLSSHVGKKITEGKLPPVTHRYAPSSVVGPCLVVGVSASLPHVSPRLLLPGWKPCFLAFVSISLAVLSPDGFHEKASARLGMGPREIASARYGLTSAITGAEPPGSRLTAIELPCHRQASKPQSGHIEYFIHQQRLFGSSPEVKAT